ncbi:Uncharacterized protein APZ42_032854 [Daphnia magna]|uniref:Uncharacterized protein n=1 Tax=Daphnia magna TaxID=35525 RepID=A0A164LXN0_9CRUS|nr:Uncharacterized protein APZ42_032854 [Daphnia magna]
MGVFVNSATAATISHRLLPLDVGAPPFSFANRQIALRIMNAIGVVVVLWYNHYAKNTIRQSSSSKS